MQRPTSTEATVDYYSFTCSDEVLSPLLEQRANLLMLEEAKAGALPHQFIIHGYTGVRCGNVQVGRSSDRLWVSLIGEVAQPHWQNFHRREVQVTRVDLALTARFAPAADGLARHEFSRLCALNSPGARRKWSIVQGHDGGSTLYIGSRKSERFGRLYDRGIKAASDPQGALWRWEVEYKGGAAQAVADALASLNSCDTMVAGLVSQWFTQRNVAAPEACEVQEPCGSTLKRKGMADDKLAWLGKQVAPSVKILISAGYRTDVLAALNLESEG